MIHGQPLDDIYFGWLCSLAGVPEEDENHLRVLYSIPFETHVPNDENRAEDGMALREEFVLRYGINMGYREREWMRFECSIFEMMVALSERAAFQSDLTVGDWLGIITENLGIRSGQVPPRAAARKLNRRTYAADGTGGMFPLMHPNQDQREVEIWYQMSAYLIENGDY